MPRPSKTRAFVARSADQILEAGRARTETGPWRSEHGSVVLDGYSVHVAVHLQVHPRWLWVSPRAQLSNLSVGTVIRSSLPHWDPTHPAALSLAALTQRGAPDTIPLAGPIEELSPEHLSLLVAGYRQLDDLLSQPSDLERSYRWVATDPITALVAGCYLVALGCAPAALLATPTLDLILRTARVSDVEITESTLATALDRVSDTAR